MNVGFVTAVELGLECLNRIAAIGGRLRLVMTLQDDTATAKSGRASFDAWCRATSTPLHKVRNINDDVALDVLRAADLDWLFIVGWSQIAREHVLRVARHGVLGIHPTLLPEGRGRAPIPWTILKGLRRTGVTLFRIDTGVDSGPIALQQTLDVAPDETATTLYARIATAHGDLLARAWPLLERNELPFSPQDDSVATYWPGRKPEDGAIDLEGAVDDAARLVRAVTRPYPGAFVVWQGCRIRVWTARVEARESGSPGVERADDGLRIQFRDGLLVATEWQDEVQQ